ncbi:hypothetical protein M3P05_12780 [Sansalvadorimonas sp. 2012CJ34-2]|uniref:Uncharacterized protein n=1 Tax=Parendozoicomonas callyspongiae TaxID=2942213 RepID=A0ABT0PHD6_9GAMM|nr:hypothetical protein [Sansalvadorimonas sp. 2012CJ34-2]MCL6270799.1 hypothetical protein [Sansalvadorimonas sp. 2012CJ34-2]
MISAPEHLKPTGTDLTDKGKANTEPHSPLVWDLRTIQALGETSLEKMPAKPASSTPEWVQRTCIVIENTLNSNPTQQQLLDTYHIASTTALKEGNIIVERGANETFKKIKLDFRLVRLMKKLIAKSIELRFRNYLALKSKEDVDKWFKEYYSDPDMQSLRTNKELDRWARLGAYVHAVRHEVLIDNKDAAEFLPSILNPTYNFLLWAGSHSRFYRPRVFAHKLTDEQADRVELYAALTNSHDLTETNAAPDCMDISDNGLGVILPQNGKYTGTFDEALWKPGASGKRTLLLMDSQNRIPSGFSESFRLCLPPNGNYSGLLALLFPASQELWLIPEKKDNRTPSWLDIVKMNQALHSDKAVNILYICTEQTHHKNLEELRNCFHQITQFSIATPFRHLTQSKECEPENGLWTLQDFSLMEKYLDTFPAGRFGLQFDSFQQTFWLQFRADKPDISNNPNLYLQAPFSWQSESGLFPDSDLQRRATGLVLELYNTFICLVTLKKIDEIDDPCFDETGNVFERSALEACLKEKSVNPATQTSMTERDILKMPKLLPVLQKLQEISRLYQLDRYSLHPRSPSPAPELPESKRNKISLS